MMKQLKTETFYKEERGANVNGWWILPWKRRADVCLHTCCHDL